MQHLAAADDRRPPTTRRSTRRSPRLDDLARLEAWRLTARLAAATGRADLWATAERYAEQLAAACGPDADRVRAWTQSELTRLRDAERRRHATFSLTDVVRSGR